MNDPCIFIKKGLLSNSEILWFHDVIVKSRMLMNLWYEIRGF